MSTTSLLEGAYESLDGVCNLIDRVLLQSLSNSRSINHEDAERLAAFFTPQENAPPSIDQIRVSCLLRSDMGEELVDRTRLSAALQSIDLDQSVLDQLKYIASLLEEERTRSAHRLMRR